MELQLAVRRLLARPGYTAILVLIVAVGIGAATTVFSVVDALLLRPAPFAYADRLVDVLDANRATRGGGNSLTPEKIAGWQRQPALFERFEAYAPQQFDLSGAGEPERIEGELVSIGLFSMLGVEPRFGRSFGASDGRPGSSRVVLIGEALWQRRFAGQPEAIGATLLLNEQPYTIVGVMPRRFHLQDDRESAWLPLDVDAHSGTASPGDFYGLGRLARGVTLPTAQRLADDIADRLQRETPLTRTWDLRLDRKRAADVDETTASALYVLLGAVGFVLLITCANVANLFLSRAPLRLREMAIQSALGSGRARLIRSVLAESVLIAAAGGALGMLLARWGIDGVLAAAPARLSYLTTSTIEIDGRVVAIAMALTLVTGVLIGLLPAIRVSRTDLEGTLRGTAPAARSAYRFAPSALVVLEVAVSIVLLIGTALMARTMVNLGSIDPGFEPRGLIALHVDLPTDRYASTAARQAFFATLFERLTAVPGISGAATAYGVPPQQGGFSFGTLAAEGGTVTAQPVTVPFNRVTPGYFATLRIPLLRGRNFSDIETNDASVIVSQGLADRLWPGANAIGRRFRIGNGPWRTVLGVVANVETLAAVPVRNERTALQMYYPWVVKPAAASTAPAEPRPRSYDWRLLVVRATDPSTALPDIKRQIWALDPNQPIDRVALVTDMYAEAFARQRFVLLLMGAFSAIALALTAAGIVGVLSQTVIRRTREIGIRMALGARPADVMRQILSRGLAMTLLGAAAGLAGAVVVTRVLRTLLFGISPTDPLSFAAVATFFVAVGLLACWLPARAAMRIEPASALRVE
jgi:predicted permease